jgi:hypothetical protein
MTPEIEKISKLMETQDYRCTSYPLYIIVEDKKVWGVKSDYAHGKERKDYDNLERDMLCDKCKEVWDTAEDELPEDCDEYECEDSFDNYRLEQHVPNLYAGFFFTEEAAKTHLANKGHHYNSTAVVYAISAVYNYELRSVMEYLSPNARLK